MKAPRPTNHRHPDCDGDGCGGDERGRRRRHLWSGITRPQDASGGIRPNSIRRLAVAVSAVLAFTAVVAAGGAASAQSAPTASPEGGETSATESEWRPPTGCGTFQYFRVPAGVETVTVEMRGGRGGKGGAVSGGSPGNGGAGGSLHALVNVVPGTLLSTEIGCDGRAGTNDSVSNPGSTAGFVTGGGSTRTLGSRPSGGAGGGSTSLCVAELPSTPCQVPLVIAGGGGGGGMATCSGTPGGTGGAGGTGAFAGSALQTANGVFGHAQRGSNGSPGGSTGAADPSTHPAGRGGYNTLSNARDDVGGLNGGGGGGGGVDRGGPPQLGTGTGAYTLATGATCGSGGGGGGGASWWKPEVQLFSPPPATNASGQLTLSYRRIFGTTWTATGPCGTQQRTVVPAGVTSMDVLAIGAAGGRGGSQAASTLSGVGGPGGAAGTTVPVQPGQTIWAVVGCPGANGRNAATPSAAGWARGGGTGRGSIIAGRAGAGGGGGGGASAVCVGGTLGCLTPPFTVNGQPQPRPVVVAGGGGGGGVSNCAGKHAGPGGAGGSGSASSSTTFPGTGPSGTPGLSANGAGGAGGVNSTNGASNGGTAPNGSGGGGVNVVGGGGGGGFVGGLAGGRSSTGCKGGGGGGGGSSWISAGTQRWTAPSAGRPATVMIDFAVPAL